ncbi:MAG: 2-phospho-L-lactate guanylyltransferase [Anaerolineales bacterium]
MSIWAIVPVKALEESKSRLRHVRTPNQRMELSRTMLLQTLSVLREVKQIERTLVVSKDPTVLDLAVEQGADALEEGGVPALNKGLSQATEFAEESQAEGILVLPADLPLVQASDVQALIEHAQDPPVVVVAPDRRQIGTNALLVAPPGTIEYEFGPDSYNRHLRRAEASGARIKIVELPALGLDVDAPEDLEIYKDYVALIGE